MMFTFLSEMQLICNVTFGESSAAWLFFDLQEDGDKAYRCPLLPMNENCSIPSNAWK